MGSPISFEQILQEVQGGRWGKPDPLKAALAPQAPPPPPQAPDPFAMAQQRAQLMGALGQMSNVANPETELAQQGQAPQNGLIQLLMGLFR